MDHKNNHSERKFGKPANGKDFGERKFGRPASGKDFGERKFGRPANGKNFAEALPHETTGISTVSRRLALEVLSDVHNNGAFANLSLSKKFMNMPQIKNEDRKLLTNLVYGTLENQILLDYALDQMMDRPTNDTMQRDILRMGAYQILLLDRVPDRAAVDEAVKLARSLDMENATGFINAVLRNLSRKKSEISWPEKDENLTEFLHVMTSTPKWLVEYFITTFGDELATSLLTYKTTSHTLTVRPNFTKLTDDEFESLLAKKEYRFEKGIAPHSYKLFDVQALPYDEDYSRGNFSIQGESSMLAAEAVQAKNGMKIIDACAAPGGKSAYLAEKMQLTGRVFSWELHEKRALLLEATKRRLRLDNMRVIMRDATVLKPDMERTVDAVLLDAPCSGTGMLYEKPDIKYRLQLQDIDAITATQQQLLETLSTYVKVGGVLVYSTCSILPDENEKQIERFLQTHTNYEVEKLPTSFPKNLLDNEGELGLQLYPFRDKIEGFYIVRLRRKS